MAWLFNISGVMTVLTACSLAGFLKSIGLKKRHKKLLAIYRSMSDLRERIRMGGGEIERLVYLCFEEDTASISEGKAIINTMYLEKADAEILEEFFRDLGMSDSESEYERIGLYMALTLKKSDEAEKKCAELCRLYSSLGILCGLFICIFFL